MNFSDGEVIGTKGPAMLSATEGDTNDTSGTPIRRSDPKRDSLPAERFRRDDAERDGLAGPVSTREEIREWLTSAIMVPIRSSRRRS